MYSDILIVFWCYCVERRAHIINATVQENNMLRQETSHSKITGRPCDISEICVYGWYKWVKYRRDGRQFPFPSERIGRCLGPAKQAGNAMSQHIRIDTVDVLPLQTIQLLTPAEINSPVEDETRKRFNLIIRAKFSDSLRSPTPISEEPSKYNNAEEPSNIPEADDFADYDLYIDN